MALGHDGNGAERLGHDGNGEQLRPPHCGRRDSDGAQLQWCHRLIAVGMMTVMGCNDNGLIAVGAKDGAQWLLGATAMGRNGDRLIAMGATGAQQLLGAMALGRNS
jgi:hypothetical protein